MSWSERDKKRIQRVKEVVPIAHLLNGLGYNVRSDAEDREEQFSCDLHGDGRDSKPSARVYPESNSFYCFACGIARDTIATVQAKKDFGFWDTVRWLEQTYNLKPLPFDPEDLEKSKEQAAAEELAASLNMGRTFEDGVARFRSFMDALTIDRDLPMDITLKFWEALDKLVFWVSKEMMPPERARQALVELRSRLDKEMEALREGS